MLWQLHATVPRLLYYWKCYKIIICWSGDMIKILLINIPCWLMFIWVLRSSPVSKRKMMKNFRIILSFLDQIIIKRKAKNKRMEGIMNYLKTIVYCMRARSLKFLNDERHGETLTLLFTHPAGIIVNIMLMSTC